mmetsp:Transcript_34490/g.87218  ORF Transcript_34490/g.87218 Transcript_34490/m.87218 type:complete len:86 (+) Transcript_34490:59-316(+)
MDAARAAARTRATKSTGTPDITGRYGAHPLAELIVIAVDAVTVLMQVGKGMLASPAPQTSHSSWTLLDAINTKMAIKANTAMVTK